MESGRLGARIGGIGEARVRGSVLEKPWGLVYIGGPPAAGPGPSIGTDRVYAAVEKAVNRARVGRIRPRPGRGSSPPSRRAAHHVNRSSNIDQQVQSDALRRTTSVLALLLAGAVLAAPDRAAAQQEGGPPSIDSPYEWVDGSLRAAPYAAWLQTGRGELELGPASTLLYGGRARVRLTGPISLEANLGFASSERAVIDPRLSGGPAAVDTVPFRWTVAEGVFHLALTGQRTWHDIQPYALIGGGMVLAVDEPSSPALADSSEADLRFEMNAAPTVVAGVGAEWHVSETIGVGFEARDHLWRLKTPQGFFREEVLNNIEEANAPAPQETQWTNNLEFSVGLWYYF